MAPFAPTDIFVPENFHEIARLRLRKVGEISSESELVKQTRGSGSVRIPATPNAFAVVLVANHKLVQGGEIKLELPTIAQSFNCFDEHDVSRARAKTRIRCRWDNE